MKRNESLAIIKPRNSRFFYKRKSALILDSEKEAFKRAARQSSLFDSELAAIEPTPFHFRFVFEDDAGKHNYSNGDWETHAMFFRERMRTSESQALRWMDEIFNDRYPNEGMVFAIGNQAKRPKTWQLLGVLPLKEQLQAELF